MHKYVVKQPIKTADNKLVGNELVFNVENEKIGRASCRERVCHYV